MTELPVSEYAEQLAVVDYLRWKYPDVVFFAIPNGGLRNKIIAAKLKQSGVMPGVPDLFIAEPQISDEYCEYLGLFIEMKAKGGHLSAPQKFMMGKLAQAGYRCEACYGAEEAMKVIDEYLKCEFSPGAATR